MPSPNDDWGYDVSDYCAVHPDLGTMEDLDALIAAAGERGIRVLLDLVPNHTSDRHPWFADALTGRDARAPRLLRLGAAGRRRRRAEQLDLELRRLGVDVARAHGRVLPRPVPADAARPQLVERGGPRALRRHPALLVCARRRGVSDRRLPRDHQGSRAARRPAGDARRPPQAAAPHRSSPSTRPTARRCTTSCAAGAPSPTRTARTDAGGRHADPRRRDLRARARRAHALLRHRPRRAAPGLQLPLRPRRPRRRADARHRRGRRGRPAARRLAGLHRLQPRRRPPRDPLGARTTSGAPARRC